MRFNLAGAPEVGFTVSILQMEKLSLRLVTWLAHG